MMRQMNVRGNSDRRASHLKVDHTMVVSGGGARECRLKPCLHQGCRGGK